VIADDLKSAAVFAALSEEQLRALADIAERVELEAGAVLFRQGEPADALYLLMSGGVRVFKELDDGRTATLRHVRPGETFGESVIAAKVYPANTTATAPSILLRLPTTRFREELAADPDLALAIIGRMAQLLVLLNSRVEELLLPVPARLARYLLDLCHEQLGLEIDDETPAPRVCRLPTSKRELASRLGTVPETLSRTLDRFKRAGVLRLSGGGEVIEILNFAALRRLARR
jgi:CRP/FNR family transcriptional regulator, dissimilatory nitrate respiration regulator